MEEDQIENDDIANYEEVEDTEPEKSHINFTSFMITPKKESEFICETCHEVFTKKYHYISHLRTHTTKKQYQCEVCLRSFIQKSDLTIHTRVHTGDRPFKCSVEGCTKGFIQKSDLNKHIRVHTGEKPFVCDICDKGFIQSGDLTKHYRIHTGDKPYQCTKCDNSFIQKSDLNKHMKKHEIYFCRLCSSSFTLLNVFSKHLKVKHNIELKDSDKVNSFANSSPIKEVKSSKVKIKESLQTKTPVYECKFCFTSNLDKKVVLKHLQSNHASEIDEDDLSLFVDTTWHASVNEDTYEQSTSKYEQPTFQNLQVVTKLRKRLVKSGTPIIRPINTRKLVKSKQKVNNHEVSEVLIEQPLQKKVKVYKNSIEIIE